MDAFIEAIKSNDLIKAKKAFGAIMSERTVSEVEEMRVSLAKAIVIEGEESEEKETDSKDEKENKDKPEKPEKKEGDSEEDKEDDE